MPWTKPVHAAVTKADLRFARHGDDELPPWGVVPIAKTARLGAAKGNALRCQERGEFGMGCQIQLLDV